MVRHDARMRMSNARNSMQSHWTVQVQGRRRVCIQRILSLHGEALEIAVCCCDAPCVQSELPAYIIGHDLGARSDTTVALIQH